MPRKEGLVFRVTQIPLGCTIRQLSSTLMYVFQSENVALDCDQSILCPSCFEDDETQIALIHFQPYPPSALENLHHNDTFMVDFMGSEVHIDKSFYGLTQLYPTGGQIKADIVALSGLNGHAYGSWAGRADNRGQKKMWLRHFLAQDLPACRTMIYGYNSDLTSHSIHEIQDYTSSFLEQLVQARQGNIGKNRPIIFIGHSFGGVIIAQSIVEAKENKIRFGALSKSTRATMFFGTPHRGLVVDDILASIKEDSPRQDLVKSLELGAKGLERELQRFINYSTRIDLKIISFKEMGQTKKLVKGPDGQWSRAGEYFTAVDCQSSILRLPDSIEETLSVEGDHSTMVKFGFKGHRTYTGALRHLKNITEDIRPGSPTPQLSATIFPSHLYPPNEDQTSSWGPTFTGPGQGNIGYEGTGPHSPAPSYRAHGQLGPPSQDQASPSMGMGTMGNSYITSYGETSHRSMPSQNPTAPSGAYFAQPWQRDRGTVGNSYLVPYGSPSHQCLPNQDQIATSGAYFAQVGKLDRGHPGVGPHLPSYITEQNPEQLGTSQPYSALGGTRFINLAHEAVVNRNAHALDQYLQNPGVTLDNGVTYGGRETSLLHIASSNGDDATVFVLLKRGARPTVVNEIGLTALHEAATRGHDKVVKLLLDYGAVVRAELKDNWNALHLAAQGGYQRVVWVLLMGGADINAITRHRWTALHLAASAGHERVVEMLLQNRADIRVKLEGDWSALHLAADYGHDRVVKVLLANHANIDEKKRDGWNPLHLAASKGNEGVIRELLANKVDLSVKINGRKARDIAAAEGHKRVEILLKEAAKGR